jgi:threonine dehydratase
VIGVEPATGDDHARSRATGRRVRVEVPRTIADGLGAPEPGELTWQVNSKLVDEFVAVEDAELVEAMRFLFDRLKVVVEPSGAAGVAAYLQGRVPRGRVGI